MAGGQEVNATRSRCPQQMRFTLPVPFSLSRSDNSSRIKPSLRRATHLALSRFETKHKSAGCARKGTGAMDRNPKTYESARTNEGERECESQVEFESSRLTHTYIHAYIPSTIR